MRSILPESENPALRERAREVPLADIQSARIKALIQEMKQLLAEETYGVALAAPQVGEALKIFVVSGRALARGERNAPDEPQHDDAKAGAEDAPEPHIPDQVYINPELLKLSRGRKDLHEGCLSIRGKWGLVPRAQKASVRAIDEEGRPFTRGASGFLAHIFQHEIDHLDGILYTDKATDLYEEDAAN